jgi:hypothetical protein
MGFQFNAHTQNQSAVDGISVYCLVTVWLYLMRRAMMREQGPRRLPFNPGTITQMKTTMDDELIQVKAKIAATEEKLTNAEIAATEANLTEAKRQRKEELVLSLTNLLARLYEKELLLLSAGEIYCNIGA